ncbi:hypothetical protein BJX76DRAFT_363509 [Aspergillus varians]
MPNRSKKKPPRSLKGLHRDKHNTSSIEPSPGSGAHKASSDNTKRIEASFHFEDKRPVDLPSPRIPVTDTDHVPEEYRPANMGSPKGTSIRKRLRALTSASAKSSPESSRQSYESMSSPIQGLPTQGSHVSSGSLHGLVTTKDTGSPDHSLVSASTFTQMLKGKRKSDKGASPRKVSGSASMKYMRSPHDYMMVDLGYCEAQAAMKSSPDDGQPNREPQIGRSSFDELLAYVRRETGTEVVTVAGNDPKVPRRPNDIRSWDQRNLRCVDCRKFCPICNTVCCVREEMVQKASDESLSPKEAEYAKIIDFLGARAKDASTFSRCTPPDGCGRYVCPSCCAVCPNELCQDIQCKECKPNVWDSCD